jgi:hypothetical protein
MPTYREEFSWMKFLVIIVGSFLGAVFVVIQWMRAHQYIQGQVDWNRVGNDTMAWFQSLSAQISNSHIFGTLGIPATCVDGPLEYGIA